MKRSLMVLFTAILAAMLWVTVRASLDRSVVTAAVDLWNDPWGRATLFDAYFGFLTFYVWVAFKEARWSMKVCWFFIIMALGNIAMSAYLIRELLRLGPQDSWSQLLTRRNA